MASNPATMVGPLPSLGSLPHEIQDMIAGFLSMQDLDRLSRACRGISRAATRALYMRDAKGPRPTAIRWAALNGKPQESENFRTNINTICTSVRYGGMVDVSGVQDGDERPQALHLAAAMGRTSIVQLLLGFGANILAQCCGSTLRKDVDSVLDPKVHRRLNLNYFGHHVTEAMQSAKWLPLAFAFFNRQFSVISTLVNAGAPSRLAGHTDDWWIDGSPVPAVTVLHVMATMTDREIRGYRPSGGFQGRLLNYRESSTEEMPHRLFYTDLIVRFRQSLDVALPRNGYTALHLAVIKCNPVVFAALMDSGADFDIRSTTGQTPLVCAITECALSASPDRRLSLLTFIHMLLKAGADPNGEDLNGPGGYEIEASPLASILPNRYQLWTDSRLDDLRTIIYMLVKSGARINGFVTPEKTVLHMAGNKVLSILEGRLDMEELPIAEKVVAALCEAGADPSIPMGDGRTLLGMLIYTFPITERYTYVPTPDCGNYFRTLMHNKARISPIEADIVFERWLLCPWLRQSSYDAVLQCGPHVDQDVVDIVYHRAVLAQDKRLWDAIGGRLRPPRNSSSLLAEALAIPRHRFWPEVRACLPFDPRYRCALSSNYLHMVVRKLRNKHYRNANEALDDAQFFVGHGVPVAEKDGTGRDPIDLLRQMGADYAFQLRLFLVDARQRQERAV